MSGEKHSRQKEQPVQRPQGSRGVSGTFKGQRGSRCDGRKGGGYFRSWGTGGKIPRRVVTLQISCAFVLKCCSNGQNSFLFALDSTACFGLLKEK